MTVQLAPPIVFQSILSNGAPNAFGFVYTYIAGTTTPQATWPDATQTTPNTNPVQLNAFGQASIWLATNLVYKIVVTDFLGNQISFQDQVSGGALIGLISSSIIPSVTNTYSLGSPTNSWAQLYLGANNAPAFNSTSGVIGFYPTLGTETGVVNNSYAWWDNRRFGMVADSGVTDNKTRLQNACTSTVASGFPLIIYGVPGQYYGLTDGVTSGINLRIIGYGKPELRWSAVTRIGTTAAGVTTHPMIECLPSSGVGNPYIDGVLLTGPSGAGVFTAGETGVLMVGASASNRAVGFRIENSELRFIGQFAICTQYTENFLVRYNRIHDCGYSGGTHFSPLQGLHEFNEIFNITPGSGGNAYGDNFTHNSIGYFSDTNVVAGLPRQAVNPYPISCTSRNNFVHDIPLWAAVDFHGGFDCCAELNTTYNCFIHIQLSASSNQASAFAGENNSIVNNTMYYNQWNGNASTVNATRGSPIARGVIANGGTVAAAYATGQAYAAGTPVTNVGNVYICATAISNSTTAPTGTGQGQADDGGTWNYFSSASSGSSFDQQNTHRNVVIQGNKAFGALGDANGTSGAAFVFEFTNNRGVNVTGNTVLGHNGVAFYCHHSDGTISNNTIGAPTTAASSYGIYLNGNCGEFTIMGNKHSPNGGNVLSVGMDCATFGMTRMLVVNDFNSATTPYGSGLALLTRGNSDIPPRLQVTNSTGGSQTIDVGPLGKAPDVYVEMAPGAAFNLTGFLNGGVGGRIWCSQTGVNSVTVLSFTNAGTQKIGGAGNAVMTQFSTMGFLTISTSSPKQYEISRMLGGQ